jgi:hypothetical protein
MKVHVTCHVKLLVRRDFTSLTILDVLNGSCTGLIMLIDSDRPNELRVTSGPS